MVARLIVTAAVASLLAGCWPARFTYRTGIMGTVVSSFDGNPVVGASIRLSVPRADLVPNVSILTTREGRFEVEPYYEWGVNSVLGESWPIQGSVEISAPGYMPYRQELTWPQTGPRTQNLGTIRLALTQ